MSQLGKIMALDVGNARVGVAMSDAMQITAQPHCTIEIVGKKALREIAQIAVVNKVLKIIVGLPLELSGKEGDQAKAVKKFATDLQEILIANEASSKIEIIFWDERFTTKAAERVLIGSKLKNRERSAALDRISAALILEGYMGIIREQ
jgi:putative Holliday junction resolvase